MSIVEQLEASGDVLSPAVRAAIECLEAMVAQLQERVREPGSAAGTELDEFVEASVVRPAGGVPSGEEARANNAAERALRKAVLWRKGCFGSQSEAGLRYAERILLISATCQQHQTHPLDFVARSIAALRSGTLAPKLLPAI